MGEGGTMWISHHQNPPLQRGEEVFYFLSEEGRTNNAAPGERIEE
jgi:hypothetical protein